MAGQLWKYDSIRGSYHNEDTTDSSGNGNTLTAEGASIVAGKLNNAYSFTTNDYLTANGLIADLATDTTGTIAFWAYLDTDNGVSQTMCSVAESTGVARSEINILADFATAGNPMQLACTKDGVTQWNIRTTTTDLGTLTGGWASFIIKHNGTEVSEVKINNTSQSLNFLNSTTKASWMKAIITDATDKANTFSFGALNVTGTWGNFLEGDLDEMVVVGDVWDSVDDTAFWNGGTGQIITNPSLNTGLTTKLA